MNNCRKFQQIFGIYATYMEQGGWSYKAVANGGKTKRLMKMIFVLGRKR